MKEVVKFPINTPVEATFQSEEGKHVEGRYRWVAEEQVPEHIDRTRLPKREVRRTLCEFGFAIERAETSGTYGKPAEHWQRFRDAIRTGTARSVEKFTRRGKSVAREIDVDTALYRIPNPDVANEVNTIQKMAQKRVLVAATLIATSASEFFTQDIEDADPGGRNIETGSHPPGTREAHICERALARLENYVIETLENLGTDGKGRYRKLEGKTTTLSLRACPPSVEVTDESAITPEHKTLTLKLPAATWEQLLDGLDVEQPVAVLRLVKSPEVSIDKRSIKAAIDGGADVPGANLATGRHSLRRS